MARIRTIKPDFWGSGDIKPLSRDARLLFVGLISMADDEGRFLGALNAINGFVYPNDDLPTAKVRRWLGELVDGGIVHLYECDGVTYGCLPSWHKHQAINRPSESKYPAPLIECAPRKQGGGQA